MDGGMVGVLAAGAAAVGAAAGSVGTKLIERLLPSTDKRVDELTQFRQELAGRLDQVQKELDEWKLKYFDLLGLYHDLQVKHEKDHTELEIIKSRVVSTTRGGRRTRLLSPPRKGRRA
jgi:hypothetical protein